ALPLLASGRARLRAAVARCRASTITVKATARGGHTRARRKLAGGSGCHGAGPPGGVVPPGQGPAVGNQGSPSGNQGVPVGPGTSPTFSAGAAVADFTPPLHGQVPNDASDCDPTSTFDGPRKWAFTEPYKDQQASGHFDQGDPYVDCNQNGRWDGNLIGGGSGTPRFFTKSADPVTSRALVVGNGSKTVAVEVTDQEGLFNVY